MKKILVSIMVIMMLLSGCTPYSSSQGESNKEVSSTETMDSHFNYIKCLTLTEIKSALTQEGLVLIENRNESPAYYQIDDTMPFIFNVEDSNQILLIYVFKTIGQLKQVNPYGGLNLIFWVKDILPQKGNYPSIAYAAHNVLIVDLVKVHMPQEITSRDEQILKSLQEAALSLNDSRKAVFADKGTYWDVRYVSDYYQHWYKDDNDTTHLDQDSKGKWTVKYTGPNPESIRNLKFECNAWSGGGCLNDSGNGILDKIGDSYYLRYNNDVGIPDNESAITVNIEWDGQQESLDLKMIK